MDNQIIITKEDNTKTLITMSNINSDNWKLAHIQSMSGKGNVTADSVYGLSFYIYEKGNMKFYHSKKK